MWLVKWRADTWELADAIGSGMASCDVAHSKCDGDRGRTDDYNDEPGDRRDELSI